MPVWSICTERNFYANFLTDVEGSAVQFYKEVDLRVRLYGCRCLEWCKKKKKNFGEGLEEREFWVINKTWKKDVQMMAKLKKKKKIVSKIPGSSEVEKWRNWPSCENDPGYQIMVEDNIIGSLGCGEDNDVVTEREADPGT